MSGPLSFHCSICEEASIEICNWCTKDACTLHICDKCKRCSDCCACDVPLNKEAPAKLPIRKEPVVPELVVPEPVVPENVQEEP